MVDESKCENGAQNIDEEIEQVSDWELQLAQKDQQYEELAARFLRLQADFDNYRRRTKQEREELVTRASERLISKLLPVLDDFERALSAVADNASDTGLAQGVEMIYRALLTQLEGEGLQSVPGVGAIFDPRVHDVVACSESEANDDDSLTVVVEVYRKGYQLSDRVIRPAMVKVGQLQSEEPNKDNETREEPVNE